MIQLLCASTCALILITTILCVRLHLMRKAAKEIASGFRYSLAADTNTLIDLSTRDRSMRMLASEINRNLRLLREQQNRYRSGDRELKDAIANISHDLRTPLTAICGYLELLEQEDQSDAVRKYISIISGRAEALKELTEELLRYCIVASTDDALERSPVNINRALEEAIVAHYAALCNRSITPEIHIPDTAVVRNLNHAALSRIFGNLIANAIRHSDGDLSIFLLTDGTIVFANTASNLDEVQVGRLFDRFYTVESARQSTGLGLSISKLLTEQMGGQIFARLDGARLSITLRFET